MGVWTNEDGTMLAEYEVERGHVSAPYGNTHVDVVETSIIIDRIEISGHDFPRDEWAISPETVSYIMDEIRRDIE